MLALTAACVTQVAGDLANCRQSACSASVTSNIEWSVYLHRTRFAVLIYECLAVDSLVTSVSQQLMASHVGLVQGQQATRLLQVLKRCRSCTHVSNGADWVFTAA